MTSLEEQFQKSCKAYEIPGVVLLASDVTGNFKYQKAFGPKTPEEPMDLNSTFTMASCTKLMTAISALQCVERGQIKLDESVYSVLPELKDLQIIVEWNKGQEPVYKKSTTAITLRHLLTHTSGLGYDLMDPRYHQYRQSRGEAPGTRGMSMLDRITLPLLFEPGTGWIYGVGLDWVGLLIARLNNTTLEAYMEKNIWTPLGIKNITFHLELKPEVKKNLVKMTARKGIPNPAYNLPAKTDEGVEWTDFEIYDNPIPTTDEFGGQGAYGSPVEYMKILTSLLSPTSILLKPSTTDEMFAPQLGDEPLKVLNSLPFFGDAFGSQPLGTKVSWGLAGMLLLQDTDSGKKKGTLNWSGLPNLLWTIDREAGLALFYASNVFPFGDFKSGEMQMVFEKEMYKRFADIKRAQR